VRRIGGGSRGTAPESRRARALGFSGPAHLYLPRAARGYVALGTTKPQPRRNRVEGAGARPRGRWTTSPGRQGREGLAGRAAKGCDGSSCGKDRLVLHEPRGSCSEIRSQYGRSNGRHKLVALIEPPQPLLCFALLGAAPADRPGFPLACARRTADFAEGCRASATGTLVPHRSSEGAELRSGGARIHRVAARRVRARRRVVRQSAESPGGRTPLRQDHHRAARALDRRRAGSEKPRNHARWGRPAGELATGCDRLPALGKGDARAPSSSFGSMCRFAAEDKRG